MPPLFKKPFSLHLASEFTRISVAPDSDQVLPGWNVGRTRWRSRGVLDGVYTSAPFCGSCPTVCSVAQSALVVISPHSFHLVVTHTRLTSSTRGVAQDPRTLNIVIKTPFYHQCQSVRVCMVEGEGRAGGGGRVRDGGGGGYSIVADDHDGLAVKTKTGETMEVRSNNDDHRKRLAVGEWSRGDCDIWFLVLAAKSTPDHCLPR